MSSAKRMGPHMSTPAGRPRARRLGIPFRGHPGAWNAITDVPGVEVGYTTLIEGESVRTGVTAIHPRGKDGSHDAFVAGFHSQNGQGEMTGMHAVGLLGSSTGPIAITGTHAVGRVHTAIGRWAAPRYPSVVDGWLLPVVAETWDGYLNDFNGRHVSEEHALEALDAARAGPLEEGSVGGGTGMTCYGFNGGSGTSSREIAYGNRSYTLGVFVQANFGAREELCIAGVPVGRALTEDNPVEEFFAAGAGSLIVVAITDAPMLPKQCEALAKRATLGVARTGTSGEHSSGDLFLVCSVANPEAFTPADRALTGQAPERLDRLEFVPWGYQDPFYQALADATEEAILNALVANEDISGFEGRRAPGLPRERIEEMIRPALASWPRSSA